MRRIGVIGTVLALAGCSALRDAFSAHPQVAGTAAGQTLTVERLANLVGHAQRIPVRVAIDKSECDRPLRAGMSTVITIDTGLRRITLLLELLDLLATSKDLVEIASQGFEVTPRQGAADRFPELDVRDRGERRPAHQRDVLPDAVEDDDRVVDRVAEHG